MCSSVPTSANVRFDSEEMTLVKNPLKRGSGEEYTQSEYALFPGMNLAASEPGLVVMLYDSLLNQYPDTAMFLYYAREGSDPMLNRKWSERLLTRWRNLGKPTLIVPSPEDRKFLKGVTTEIPLISLYDVLLTHNISGGCNREIYRLIEPENSAFKDDVRELAINMGVTLYDDQSDIGTEKIRKIPYLTSSIDLRNSLKKQGFEAVHILELIYGMGPSNTHLAHSHDGPHDHSSQPAIRDVSMSPEEKKALDDLFSHEARTCNLRELKETLLSLFWDTDM